MNCKCAGVKTTLSSWVVHGQTVARLYLDHGCHLPSPALSHGGFNMGKMGPTVKLRSWHFNVKLKKMYRFQNLYRMDSTKGEPYCKPWTRWDHDVSMQVHQLYKCILWWECWWRGRLCLDVLWGRKYMGSLCTSPWIFLWTYDCVKNEVFLKSGLMATMLHYRGALWSESSAEHCSEHLWRRFS